MYRSKAASLRLSNKRQRLFGSQDRECSLYVKRAKGAYIYDFDNNKYIDFHLNNGAFILGHSNPIVTRHIKNYVSRGFFYNLPSNIELRLASIILELYNTFRHINFFTSKIELLHKLSLLCGDRKSILLVGNHYKKIQDYTNIQTLTYSGALLLEAINDFIKKMYKKISAVCIDRFSFSADTYDEEFWTILKELCLKYKLKLIIDEEITAFRLPSINSLEPDYVILGNVIAGGFPLWGLLFREQEFSSKLQEIECNVSPLYYIAGLETIKYLRRKEYHSKLESLINTLREGIKNINISIKSISSIFSIEYKRGDEKMLFDIMLENNILLSQYYPQFLSVTHDVHSINRLIKVLNRC